jgi:hypothetical protein
VLLTASTTRAEPPDEGALARFERSATQAVEEGRYADARNAWLAIWQLDASNVAACNVGQLSFRIADLPRAAEFLTICLRDEPKPTDEATRRRHERRVLDLAQARQRVGVLTFRVRDGAELTVDDQPVGRAPLDRALFVTPGSHEIRAELDGEEGEAEVDIPAGAERRVVIELAPPPDKPRTWIVVVGAASSAAFVGAGVGFLVTANAQESHGYGVAAKHQNGCYGECPAAVDSWETTRPLRGVGYGALAIGAALGAGTLTYALWPRSGGPTLKVGAAGVRLEGTWTF